MHVPPSRPRAASVISDSAGQLFARGQIEATAKAAPLTARSLIQRDRSHRSQTPRSHWQARSRERRRRDSRSRPGTDQDVVIFVPGAQGFVVRLAQNQTLKHLQECGMMSQLFNHFLLQLYIPPPSRPLLPPVSLLLLLRLLRLLLPLLLLDHQ